MSRMKEEKEFCPYCGSNEIALGKITPDMLVDPAPSMVDIIKNAFHKKYKCQKCGKEFN